MCNIEDSSHVTGCVVFPSESADWTVYVLSRLNIHLLLHTQEGADVMGVQTGMFNWQKTTLARHKSAS